MALIKNWLLMVFLLILGSRAMAINVGAITESMPSSQSMISKEISNTVDVARLVSLNVERISSPLEQGKVIPMESQNEIMVTPANLILPGKAKEVFRIFYAGPKDDRERYYRLIWQDNPVVEEGNSKSTKTAMATTSATISTLMVVTPRKENLEYRYESGVISNLGNSSFRVVASGPCILKTTGVENKMCRERYYVMPGLAVHLKFVDYQLNKSSIGIWFDKNYITVK
ncbi:fimbria/pilus periplasmic chaperone [Klebsiella aerogenes]|uniref:EcpB family pilus assembly chaperone n=1 Tax=Klebsiella aerogenes TaxID=548 RepID=UPI001CFA009B|nr:fimbria/pilus periplasmic chaperone [Klebsiella aerogenes]EKV3450935.1 fimbria/pilus periplasmic chaperone [Klebsiella aerogenes]EKV8810945.1 fimbria/pilus periplasmic chaperone [Klebsiella aerogenes]ELJ2007721.1 fimbria/pilus periplasmic chaperone [Klebsiella aerogenes]ELW9553335.1 fimbria/pilus periplasmic chaperone [Klebsiella aerogenes]EMF0803276.1 fimbria/pilus periplasmic chaperone [Klebsiella aerogenes]